MNIDHLIVATDLNQNSGIAAQWAADVADKIGAKITALHVVETGFLTWFKNDLELFEDENALTEAKAKISNWFQEHTGRVPDDIIVRAGSPLPQIEKLVRELDGNSMIVLARSSKGGFEKFFVGSTVQQIVARPPAPVAIVHPEHVSVTNNHPIVTGTDFSENAHLAVQFAADLGRDVGADVHLLHVNSLPESNAFSDVGGIGVDFRDRVQELANQKMESFVEGDVELSGVECTADVVFDKSAADAIVETADDDEADVVVVGHNGSSALVQNILGSVTQQVLRNSPSTVVVVPVPESDDEEE